ncbi:MAG: hypothetical protein Q8L47_01145 [bacterium]|nr:hypothetical protein [bacterium]
MESTGKIILVVVLIVIFVMFAPMLYSSAIGGLGGGVLFSSGSKTLSQPKANQNGTIAISYDAGENFEEAQVHTSTQPQILVISTYQKFYIAGTNNGLIMSRDGGLNWFELSDLEKNIDNTTTIYDFANGPGGTFYIAAYKNNHGVLYVTNDNFFTVTNIWEEASMAVRGITADSEYLYMGLDDGRLLRYSFAKQTFEKITTFTSGIQTLTFVGNGNLIVGLNNGGVYTDNGTRSKFGKITTPSSNFFVSQSGLRLTKDNQNRGSLFIASPSGLYKSDDSGAFWNSINTILSTKAKVAALSVQNGLIYLTSDAKFYKSTDGGKSWKVSEPMPTNSKYGTLYVDNSGKIVIVGTRK